MGVLKVNGMNILDSLELANPGEPALAHPAFPNKIKGLSAAITNGSKIVLEGWKFYVDSYDAAKSKIKVNGNIKSIAIRGTRPRNLNQLMKVTGEDIKYILINNGGFLYYYYLGSEEGAVKVLGIESKDENKDIIFNLQSWSSGGKGGRGTYWLFAGNWGGVGGGGGSNSISTIKLQNGNYLWITSSGSVTHPGRISNSFTKQYKSPEINIQYSVYEWLRQDGAWSGFSDNTREGIDPYNTEVPVTYNVPENIYWNSPYFNQGRWKIEGILLRNAAWTKKVYNGNPGTFLNLTIKGNGISTEHYDASLKYGNPENNPGVLVVNKSGGTGGWGSSNRERGSGGGASFGTGGRAGDTGSGSAGSSGTDGSGGGGAGSPAGGADGGNGGLPGFIIAY